MKCTHCNTENLLKANYCKSCGQAFTQEEKDAARKKSAIGILEKADEVKGKYDKISDFLSLSFITDNIFVRIGLIVAPFILSLILGGGTGGNSLKIVDSGEYDVYYNTTTQEYFVEVEYSTVDLMMYVPKGTQQINVYFTESGGYQYISGSYSTDDRITVSESSNGYYTIEAVMDDGTQSIRMYTI